MNRAFSKILAASEGRFLTTIEQERSICGALELPHRLLISNALQQAEFQIVDFATQAFCDITSEFDGSLGSLRRKKGHQDGRIILRFAAQAIREGSSEILFEKVLSWLVGHLDSANVTGKHMEVFFHFLLQGARRELPPSMHPFLDATFNEIIGYVRRASASGTIHRAHRRIAEWAVDRLMEIMPEAKTKYGVAGAAKCKRDFEMLVKELARIMKAPSMHSMKRQFSGWLIERLMSQVSYSSNVWYWSFLTIREGIVESCGPEAAIAVSELLETMADHSEMLLQGVELAEKASHAADLTAKRLLERGESLGLLRVDEFQTAVAMVNRQVVHELAVLMTCGSLSDQHEALSELWEQTILPHMPSVNTGLLAANLKVLLEVVTELASEATAKSFRQGILQLVDIARRCEAASRLAEKADGIAVETADWAIDNLAQFSSDRRAAYRDLRLVIGRIVSLIATGPSSCNGHIFRGYLAKYLLPNLPFNPSVLRQVYERLQRSVDTHATADDAKLVRSYLDEALSCFDRHARLSPLLNAADRMTVTAVERGYHAAPRHASLQRDGVKAGRRDGRYLIERAVECAVVGGTVAESEFHQQFLDEQVRHSKLPGSVIVEFIRGILEQVRDYPEVSELLLGLAHAAPLYAASLRINAHSTEWASKISERTFAQATAYRDQVGESGVHACQRDNAVMLRGLARHLQFAPADVLEFKGWWRRQIGKNIRVKPENFEASGPCAKINFDQVIQVLTENLDHDEASAVAGFLHQIFETRSPERSSGGNVNTRRAPLFAPIPTITFSDVGA